MSKSLCIIVVALFLAGPAFAQETPPAAPSGQGAARCRANPEKCAEIKQRMQEKCAANPERCEQRKARAAQWREECKANPEACKEKRGQWRKRREERRASQGQAQ